MDKKEYGYSFLLWFVSTFFFIWLHTIHFSWDFAVYVLNAQYWFNHGTFFELLRTPLVSFLLGVVSIFGWKLGEYLFIIGVSALFCYASYTLAKKMHVNPTFFYLTLLSPLLLLYGLINGTELLVLALFMLFLSAWFENNVLSGLWLGLATLTRYNYVIFVPLLLYPFKVKIIAKKIGLFILTWIPWLYYNYHKTGNIFTSLADNVALNIRLREYFTQATNYTQFFELTSIIIVLSIIGLIYCLRKLLAKKQQRKELLIMSILILITLIQYVNLASKETRYLFLLALPLTYFATYGLQALQKNASKVFIFSIILLLLGNSLILMNELKTNPPQNKELYEKAITLLQEHNLQHCQTFANAWPLLSYLGKQTEQLPRKELLNEYLTKGTIIIFHTQQEPSWQYDSFLKELMIIEENKDFVIVSEGGCAEEQPYTKTYLVRLQEEIQTLYNYEINTNPCFVLFEKIAIAEKTCNFVHGNGFIQDSNRVLN